MELPILSPFKAEDIEELEARENCDIEEVKALAQIIQDGSMGFTARLEGKVIGCAGVFKKWEGTGQAWVMISDKMMKHKLWFHRIVRQLLQQVAQAEPYARIEAVVKAESERNIQWIETLGFHRETPEPMKHYRPEGDYYLYSLTGD